MVPPQNTRLRDLHALVVELKQAAEQRNGEQIGALVDRYAALSAELVQGPLAPAGAEDAAELSRMANEIIALQVEIQQLAAPWMDDLRILLRENRQGQAVNATYRTEP